jgi:Xaa-Pro aminopeptidase
MADDNLLIVADCAHSADLRYAVGLALSRPAVYLRARGRGYALVDDADLEAGRAQSRNCRVLALSRYLTRPNGRRTSTLADAIQRLTREKHVRRLVVPADFPLGLARALRDRKLRLKPRSGEAFFPERAVKSPEEVAMIRAAMVMAEVGLAEGIQALKNSQISPRGRLQYRGSPLTAERLRSVMQVAVFQAGGQPVRVTVAADARAGCPGPGANGPLRAHQPVILGLALCSTKTGYHAELARTVVRGRARDAAHQLHASVLQAHSLALTLLRNGARASEVHAAVGRCLAGNGSGSGTRRTGSGTVVHANGHGVGLDLREPPFVCDRSRAALQTGNVLAVEPGLSCPEVGAIFLEDLVLVTRHGARNLTQYEKTLEV